MIVGGGDKIMESRDWLWVIEVKLLVVLGDGSKIIAGHGCW